MSAGVVNLTIDLSFIRHCTAHPWPRFVLQCELLLDSFNPLMHQITMDLPDAFTITASSSGTQAEEQTEHPQRAAQDAPPHGRFYKSRKARPCDACRRRKVVCHMPSSPPCQRCLGKAISCTFKQAPDKKKRPAPRPSSPSQPALFSPIGQRFVTYVLVIVRQCIEFVAFTNLAFVTHTDLSGLMMPPASP